MGKSATPSRSVTLVFRGPRDGLLGTATIDHEKFLRACIVARCTEGSLRRALRELNIDTLMPLDGGASKGNEP